MCTSSCQKYELPKSADQGWTSTALPFTSLKPLGWFIQPLTAITISEPVRPVITTTTPHARCLRGEMRSHA